MKSTCLILFSILLWNVQAQLIPDFMVTDSDGQMLELYADHLDQGQSVVIKIFFTSCPPCNSVAPDIQQLYEDWGEGMGDVEFIELSDKSFDSDSRVNDYKARHSITFPSVGADGGSLDAVDPYSRAPIGPYFGTPTFIVAAPDGTYEFDVHGGGGISLIEALDAAIARTGAEKPGGGPVRPDYVLEGELRDRFGDLSTDASVRFDVRPITGAPDTLSARSFIISADQNGMLRLPTDSLEAFEWYEGRVTNDGLYSCTDNQADGLSTTNLILIQRHILNVAPFTEPYQWVAADADFNGQTNVLDLLDLQVTLLGLPSPWTLEQDCPVAQPCGQGWFLLTDRIDGECSGPFRFAKIGVVNADGF